MLSFVIAFLLYLQPACAFFYHPDVVWEEDGTGLIQLHAKAGTVLDVETFCLEAGQRLEICSPEVTIHTTHGLEIAGEIISNGNLSLHAGDGALTLKGSLSSLNGSIQLIGKEVFLEGNASIDTSSEKGGGLVSIDATQVHIGRDAKIFANGFKESNAGEVRILSDEALVFLGEIYACADGIGKGGQVEVSGKHDFTFDGIVMHSSQSGDQGVLLIDPKFARIQSLGTDPATGNTFASNPDGTVSISGSSLQTALNAGNVTIEANTDISFDENVTATTSGNGLTLRAGRSVLFSKSLTLNNAPLTIVINDENALSNDRDAGASFFVLARGAVIQTQGGLISVSPGTFGGTQEGTIMINSAELNAAGGNIVVTGKGIAGSLSGVGMSITGSSNLITTGNGTITLSGDGAAAQASIALGIQCSGNHESAILISTENGEISCIGNGGGNGTGQLNCGLNLINVNMDVTGMGSISLSGTAGSGVQYGVGTLITGSATQITTAGGAIEITGLGNGTGSVNCGIILENGVQVASNGSGTLTLQGTSGNGTNSNYGVFLSSSSSVTSSSGAVSITGQSNGSGSVNQGIRLESSALIEATNTATITLNGTGSSGTNFDDGVFMSGAHTVICGVNGNIDITGVTRGSGPNNKDIYIQHPNNVFTTGSGVVNYNPPIEL